MTKHPFGAVSETVPVIDIGNALDLLAAAVQRTGDDFVYQPVWAEESRNRSASDGIVGHALAFADVGAHELEAMPDVGVRDLYLRGDLPVTLTLGALAVFHAAQRSQDRGRRCRDVLEHATDAAVRFLDLMPDAVFDVAPHPGPAVAVNTTVSTTA